MGKHQHVALLQVGFNVVLVQVSLLLVIDQNHDNISLLCRFGRGKYLKALLYSLVP